MLAKSWVSNIVKTIRLILWVTVSFIGAQIIASILLSIVATLIPSLQQVNDALLTTIYAGLAYALAVLIAIGGPMLIKYRSSREEVGVDRLPSWKDIGAGIFSVLPYFIVSSIVGIAMVALFKEGFDTNKPQDIPFEALTTQFELLVAFITLVVFAPVAEELLFRGYLLGKLRRYMPAVVAGIVSALVFGAMHLPGSDGLQWAVAADTFALGLVLATLRLYTGAIWAGVLLHAIKNSIAFYVLFINPSILGML